MSYSLEIELSKRAIPFQKFGGPKFMETAHIKDVVAHLRVIINPDDIMLYADRSQMSQVVLNILKNAIDTCDDENKTYNIDINAFIDKEERIHIELSNDAVKIPDEVSENIFMPFFTTKQEGSGIGLAISRQIIRLHGGTLHLSKNTDEKVTFLIVLE